MKQTLIVLSICLLFIACNKDKDPEPQAKSTSSSVYDPKWIPNWIGNDTLYGSSQDSTGMFVPVDTMFTARIGDTTCVYHHGTKYYLWTSSFYNTLIDGVDSFEDNQKLYINCYIGTIPFDTLYGIKDHGLGTTAWPHKYQKDDGTWTHREQLVMVNDYQDFGEVFLNQYRSKRTYQ